jgi:Transposase DDE domain
MTKSLDKLSRDSRDTVLTMSTDDFPFWSSFFDRESERLRSITGSAIHQFESLFDRWIPRHFLAQQEDRAHSRNRLWPLRLTFWSFLWQVTQAGAACREAIRQAQSLCLREGRPLPPDTNGPYTLARGKIPLECLEDIHRDLLLEVQRAKAPQDDWCGHHVQVVDGTTLTMPDTPQNQAAYPQQSVQKPGCGFPIMRLVAFFSLATGLITTWAKGQWRDSELGLMQSLWEHLRAGEVLLGDRGFGGWAVLAQCSLRGIHGVFRLRSSRKADFRKAGRIGRNDRIEVWSRPAKRSSYLTEQQWAQFPDTLTVRLVRCRKDVRGFRTREVILVTTLLDPKRYSLQALGDLYLRRWEMELTLRNLKTTLQMDQLSCKKPGNIERELRMHLLAHNLVRRLMLEAARLRRVPLGRVSFAGALAAARRFAEALLQSTTQRKRRELYEELLRVLATDLLPERPGRREPRAVKRRPKPYPLLNRHRHVFKEIRHQSRYRAQVAPESGPQTHGLN